MQHNTCPECGRNLRLNGQKWECSLNPYHKIPLSGNMPPGSGRGRNQERVIPLKYPAFRSPAENGIGLWHKIACPYCNHEFRLYQAAIVSTIRVDEAGRNEVLRQSSGIIDFFRRNILDGPEYTSKGACYQCPKCYQALPHRYESSTNFYIGVVGDSFSGKTHYLAALLRQIAEGDIAAGNSSRAIRFSPQTNKTKEELEVYRQASVEGRIFAATEPRQPPSGDEVAKWDPLVFQMLIWPDTPTQGARSVNLVFYDLAGEDIADDTRLPQNGWPILRAHALIYLADPLSMPGVINLLRNKKKPLPPADILSTYADKSSNKVLDIALGVFKRYRRLESLQSIPVAIMLAKADILDEIIPPAERQNTTLLDPVQYDGSIHIDELKRNDDFIGKWLQSIGEMRMIHSVLQIPAADRCSFAVSATGSSHNLAGQFASIQPRRCLDPLLWILWRFAEGNS